MQSAGCFGQISRARQTWQNEKQKLIECWLLFYFSLVALLSSLVNYIGCFCFCCWQSFTNWQINSLRHRHTVRLSQIRPFLQYAIQFHIGHFLCLLPSLIHLSLPVSSSVRQCAESKKNVFSIYIYCILLSQAISIW